MRMNLKGHAVFAFYITSFGRMRRRFKSAHPDQLQINSYSSLRSVDIHPANAYNPNRFRLSAEAAQTPRKVGLRLVAARSWLAVSR